jgi:hypothetical protein
MIWPNDTFPVLQATAAAGSILEVGYDQANGSLRLKGDISLQSGQIYYFQRSFYIRSGLLSFDETETQIDPHLTVRADMRDFVEGKKVTISMLVNDSPLSSFTPRFESSPAMSQVEILSLLGQNIVGVNSSTSGDRTALDMIISSGIGDALSQVFWVRRFEQWARDVMGLDVFSFRTNFLQNVAMQMMRPDSQMDGIFGNFFDNTTIYGGLYITPDIFFHVMWSLNYRKAMGKSGGLPFFNFQDYNTDFETGLDIESPVATFGLYFSLDDGFSFSISKSFDF